MEDNRIAPCAVTLRSSAELGTTQSGGLGGRHHFSFAAYQRPDRLEWGALRALNLYRLEKGAVRPPTFHAGFEIVTLVTGGCLRRTGTFAPSQRLRAGAAELVSTGTGANLGLAASEDEPATYFEIWVRSSPPIRRARWLWSRVCPAGFGQPVAAGPVPVTGALAWRAAACLHRIVLKAGEMQDRAIANDDCIYLAVLRGEIEANGERAGRDDALAISGPGGFRLRAERPTEFLLIQTPAEA